MVGELVPVSVDPKTADRAFWRRFHDLRRVWQAESRPGEPIEPNEHAEAEMKKDNPFEFNDRYEFAQSGEMVSWLHGYTVKPENPEYATNKHLYWGDAYVRTELRRKGIASRWLPVLAELMDRHGCTVLGVQTGQESGHAFLSWLGAEPKLRNIASRLEFADVDWAMLERWTAESARRSPHTRLEVYDGGIPEPMWADFAPQITSMSNTMPLEDLDLGDQIFTPDRMRDRAERREETGTVLYTVLTREPDGGISGVTEMTWAPYRRTVLHQEFTGVRTDARGRGLGKWIKAAMLLHVRGVRPEVASVLTDNAQSNGPMLNINRTIGFKAYRTDVDYQISRSDLEKRIRTL